MFNVNALDIQATLAPALTVEQIHCMTLGPFACRLTRGLVTTMAEQELLEEYENLGNYAGADDHDARASQVSQS